MGTKETAYDIVIEEIADRLNVEFRLIISHRLLGYRLDMPLWEFNEMLDDLVKAAMEHIKD